MSQSKFHKAGDVFAQDADQGGVAGRGAASGTFAAAYDVLIQQYLELWAHSVVSIGGASTGFTETANNYRAADHASDPKAQGPPPRREPPHVIDKPPHYPVPASVLFAGSDGDDTELTDVVDEMSDLEIMVINAVMDQFKGLTRVADVFPWADADDLDGLAQTWRTAGSQSQTIGTACDNALAYITNGSHGEWQQAMRQFTRTLWGATAWGENQAGYDYNHHEGKGKASNQPILAVLEDTANNMSTNCGTLADAARSLKGSVKSILWQAVKDTVNELLDFDVVEKLKILSGGAAQIVAIFLEKLDHKALDQAVTTYETTLRDLATQMTFRQEDVDEAYRAAPTFNSEEARAQAFGARSLNEFKRNPLYTVPNDSEANHKYPVDLANQEGMGRSHTIDKHVGQSPEQLAMRLRDQPGIDAASSFTNLAGAQKYTQAALDDPAAKKQIETWLRNCERKQRSEDSIEKVRHKFDNEVTGTIVTQDAYSKSGMNAQPQNTNGVEIWLKYQPNRQPPYVVLTSVPKKY